MSFPKSQQYIRVKKMELPDPAEYCPANGYIDLIAEGYWNADSFIFGIETYGSVSLPFIEGYTYDCIVDWGDGTTDVITSWDQAEKEHEYDTSEWTKYIIKITGTCQGFDCYTDAFDNVINVFNWGNCDFRILNFGYCTDLLSIPNGPITGCENIETFAYMFFYCYQCYQPIPENLFMYGTGVTDNAFESAFQLSGFTGEIPEDLFRYNTLAGADAFKNTFDQCDYITTVPAYLFRYNTLVSGNFAFYRTFRYSSITSVPLGLFKYNLLAYNFEETFEYCVYLVLNKYIFYGEGEENTRFLNLDANFEDCFNRSTYLGAAQGEAPELWNCDFGTGTVAKTDCYNGAGNSLTSLSNYGDIPAEWK